MDFARLWLHEASRVYGDKLIETKDMENFKKLKFDISKQFFDVSIIICLCSVSPPSYFVLYHFLVLHVYATNDYCFHILRLR